MNCYLCDNTVFNRRKGKVRDNDALEIYECQSCGLVFLSSSEHIDDCFYDESHMHDDLPIDIDNWLKNNYADDERRYNFCREFIKNRSVLDFGSGAGGFALMAKNIAAKIECLELEKRLTRHYGDIGIKLYQKIDDMSGKEEYDVITAFHVIEHLKDPVVELKRLARHLKTGGRMIIEVPNANDALLKLYDSVPFSNFTYWSCHLFLYNPNTLEMLIRKCGMNIRFIKQVQRYPLSNHLYWLSKGKPGGHEAWSFLDSNDLHSAYEKQLGALGLCDTIIAGVEK